MGLRIKNRFLHPTSGGWADCLVNFVFNSDSNRHVCEVQLIHSEMMNARTECNAHAAYGRFRSAFELLEAAGEDLSDLSEDDAMFQQKYADMLRNAGKAMALQRRFSTRAVYAEPREDLNESPGSHSVGSISPTGKAEAVIPRLMELQDASVVGGNEASFAI